MGYKLNMTQQCVHFSFRLGKTLKHNPIVSMFSALPWEHCMKRAILQDCRVGAEIKAIPGIKPGLQALCVCLPVQRVPSVSHLSSGGPLGNGLQKAPLKSYRSERNTQKEKWVGFAG